MILFISMLIQDFQNIFKIFSKNDKFWTFYCFFYMIIIAVY